MTDMLKTIIPKSTQLNADDLMGGQTLTIKITDVKSVSGDQPIQVSYENDGGKPYLPCKSMRRVLVHCWGSDGKKYIGRSLALYRDDKVIFGGIAVGGIRISHMSDITSSMTMALTASKSSRKPFTVQPLIVAADPVASPELIKVAEDVASLGSAKLELHWKALSKPDQLLLKPHMGRIKEIAVAADNQQPKEPTQ